MSDFNKYRQVMIQQQLLARDIKDPRIIAAFSKVPRHNFIGEEFWAGAYEDHPLPIGANQTISQPYMAALMVQSLGLRGNERILEIGTGSGYQTAILAELCAEVYSIERIRELADHAKENLDKIGYRNIKIKCADGAQGWKEFAPFDGIIVSAASLNVPQELIAQLNINGRLVIPIGGSFSQVLTVLRKEKDKILKEEICSCIFVPLISEEIGKDSHNEG